MKMNQKGEAILVAIAIGMIWGAIVTLTAHSFIGK